MKRLITFAAIFVFAVFTSASAEELQKPQPPKTEIMVLGTYHMSNPGRDNFNLEADDVLSGTRQAEILEVIYALSAFRPTKIAIESDFGTTKRTEQYAAYLAGEYELTRNEIDQIAFRLAKMMGHEAIYPVDVDWGMGRDVDWERYFEEFAEQRQSINEYGEALIKAESEKLANSTIGQYLRFLNSDEMLEANHRFYSYFTIKDGADDWYPGPHMVANWYKRNLYIAHHLTRIAEEDGSDRILVMFGQGHAYLLKQFMDENPAFEVVDVKDYLPE